MVNLPGWSYRGMAVNKDIFSQGDYHFLHTRAVSVQLVLNLFLEQDFDKFIGLTRACNQWLRGLSYFQWCHFYFGYSRGGIWWRACVYSSNKCSNGRRRGWPPAPGGHRHKPQAFQQVAEDLQCRQSLLHDPQFGGWGRLVKAQHLDPILAPIFGAGVEFGLVGLPNPFDNPGYTQCFYYHQDVLSKRVCG